MQNSRDVNPYYNSGYEYQVGSMHLPLSLLPGHIFWRQSQTTNDRTDRLEYALDIPYKSETDLQFDNAHDAWTEQKKYNMRFHAD